MILVRCLKAPNGRLFALKSPYNKRFVELAKEVPGLEWKKAGKVWVGWRDAVLLLQDKLLAAKVGKILNPPDRLPPTCGPVGVPEELYDYQREGVEFCVRGAEEGALLADEVGLGKSVQALIAAQHLGGPILIVCPSNVKTVWTGVGDRPGQVEEWLGVKPAVLTTLTPDASRLGPITVIHYEILDAWKDVLAAYGFRVAIIDEIHAFQGYKSKRTLAFKEIRKTLKYVIALSGSPMNNRPRDLLSVMSVLSPGRFNSYKFLIRYCNAHYVDIGEGEQVFDTKGRSHEDELAVRLQSFMLRRTKEDVKLQLPPKTRQIIEVEVDAGHVLGSKRLKLDQRSMRDALALSADGKLTTAAEIAQEQLKNGLNVVIFTHLRETADKVCETLRGYGIKSYLATGAHSNVQRAQTVKAASKDAPSVLVATLDSMGTGIDLTYASICIFVELDWVPTKLIQGEGRFHRIGQVNPVTYYYLVGIETLDEQIRDEVIDKLEGIEKIIGKMDPTLRKELKGGTEEEALDRIRAAIVKRQRAA